jgi:hypothetical protein
MANVFKCDCCDDIYDIDECNPIKEELISDYDGKPFNAENEVCNECLDDIIDQMDYTLDIGGFAGEYMFDKLINKFANLGPIYKVGGFILAGLLLFAAIMTVVRSF